ncbi:MAG: M20 family metallopeptidase [Myxococcota bacterium]
MTSESEERDRILAAIDAGMSEIVSLSHWMAANPELSCEERETSGRYIEYLSQRGFSIERAVAGLETAFVAETGPPGAMLSVALLAEMDALPEIGHACGHSLSGPASLLAAAALREVVPAEQLRILVVGTPAEETGVGKPKLVAEGVFDGVDVAMMAHASDMRRAHRLFLGNRKYEFVYHGHAAHAAAYPEKGINALDGVIALFVAIGLLRQQLPRSARIHGIVSDGGQAPNIIPERAAARVWVRALEDAVLEDAAARLEACAQGAATSTGTRLEVLPSSGASPSMRANLALADSYRRQLEYLGLPETAHAPNEAIGSSDITHVSRVVPTIHPNFPIGTDLKLHTRAFAEAAASPRGEQGLLEGARALALTVAELARNPAVRRAVAAEAGR